MKFRKYTIVLASSALISLFVVGLQVFWNYQLFKANKALYIDKLQKGFEVAVDSYYYQIGEADVISIMSTSGKDSTKSIFDSDLFDELSPILKIDSVEDKNFSKLLDSTDMEREGVKVVTGKGAMDRDTLSDFRSNQITFRISRDSIEFPLLDSILKVELSSREIKEEFKIYHYKKDTVFDSYGTLESGEDLLQYKSTSEYLPLNEQLEISFTEPGLRSYLSSIWGVLLSLLFSLSIIGVIYYFYREIKRQRQLSDIKDDFIGNITHELKTPIATVSAAIEALQHFDLKNHPDKLDKYLSLSSSQLKKLDRMVEELLETATLESDEFVISPRKTNLVELVSEIVEKFRLLHPDRTIEWDCRHTLLERDVDPFYLSSAISNLVDNAVKYGGDKVRVSLEQRGTAIEITVFDNGGNLDAKEAKMVFDKFFRKGTGNRHDVKGYGIGLYFARKIVEKHGGKLELDLAKNETRFIIAL
ncbi:MAG: HAMP domain-containing sensor histidine kinase [Eudoraea sp.]|nr:HAMP domain-containing sensor histidine kinase [Eudoraea sp.]